MHEVARNGFTKDLVFHWARDAPLFPSQRSAFAVCTEATSAEYLRLLNIAVPWRRWRFNAEPTKPFVRSWLKNRGFLQVKSQVMPTKDEPVTHDSNCTDRRRSPDPENDHSTIEGSGARAI